MVRLALIPPLNMMHYMDCTRYQLMLPQLAMRRKYSEKFKLLRNAGNYVILDNGAAEKKQVRDERLIAIAASHNVHEVAIPDVMGDQIRNVARAKRFCAQHAMFMSSRFNWGFVAHGQSINDVLRGVEKLMESEWSELIQVIYIPRMLVKTTGDLHVRIKIAQQLKATYERRLAFHLFGAAPSFPRELLAVTVEAPFIRGLDTSMPFVLGLHNFPLHKYLFEEGPARPDDYFDIRTVTEDQRATIHNNVGEMLRWVGM